MERKPLQTIEAKTFASMTIKKPQLTEMQEKLIRHAKDFGVSSKCWQEILSWEVSKSDTLKLNEESRKQLNQWKSALIDVMRFTDVPKDVKFQEGVEELKFVPYFSKSWKSTIRVEHNVKIYWVNNVSYRRNPFDKEKPLVMRLNMNPAMLKRSCLDILWIAAVSMYVRNTYSKNPIYFSAETVGKACRQIAMDCADTDLQTEESRKYILDLIDNLFTSCWSYILDSLHGDIKNCSRAWLASVARQLNKSSSSRAGSTPSLAYSENEDNTNGNCIAEMRCELMEEVIDVLYSNPDWGYAEQRKYIADVTSSDPSFKGSVVDWLIRSLKEIVNEETGECLLKPFTYDDRKIDYESRKIDYDNRKIDYENRKKSTGRKAKYSVEELKNKYLTTGGLTGSERNFLSKLNIKVKDWKNQ